MAGGRSTRFGGGEKPMATLLGKPLVGWVVDALERGNAGPVSVATSPRTPATARWARARGLAVIETPGRGFVEDAALAARRLGLPLLVVAADLPRLPPETVAATIRRYGETHRPLSLWVPAGRQEMPAQGGLAPAGLNLWAPGEEERWTVRSPGLAMNVNTLAGLFEVRASLEGLFSGNRRNIEAPS